MPLGCGELRLLPLRRYDAHRIHIPERLPDESFKRVFVLADLLLFLHEEITGDRFNVANWITSLSSRKFKTTKLPATPGCAPATNGTTPSLTFGSAANSRRCCAVDLSAVDRAVDCATAGLGGRGIRRVG